MYPMQTKYLQKVHNRAQMRSTPPKFLRPFYVSYALAFCNPYLPHFQQVLVFFPKHQCSSPQLLPLRPKVFHLLPDLPSPAFPVFPALPPKVLWFIIPQAPSLVWHIAKFQERLKRCDGTAARVVYVQLMAWLKWHHLIVAQGGDGHDKLQARSKGVCNGSLVICDHTQAAHPIDAHGGCLNGCL